MREDPVVVPQILFAYRDQIQQVRKLGDDVLEVLQEVDPIVLLGGERGGDLRVPELVLELVVVESRIDRDGRGSELRACEQSHDPFRPIGEDDRTRSPARSPSSDIAAARDDDRASTCA
jgi:hypothetical protein